MSRTYSQDLDLDAFGRWITAQNGGFIHESLKFVPAVDSTEAGGSLKAVKLLPKDTRFLTCPYICTIDYIKVRAHYPETFLTDVTPHAALCLFLCREYLKGEKSFWWPYLNVLPQTFNTPLYFSPEDMAFLEGCNLNYKEVEARRESWQNEWRDGIRAMEAQGYDVEGYTWSLFLWAATIFSSRSFPERLMHPDAASTDDVADQNLPALFPLIDCMNHRPMTKITWQPSANALSVISGDDYEAGSEVLNNYGPKPNEELLMGYGFVLDPNPTDTVTLKFAPELSPYQTIIRKHQPQPQTPGIYTLFLNNSPIFPKSLTSLFRILTALPREGARLLDEPTAEYASIRNELATYTQLYLAMRRKLSGLATDPGQPQNERQAAARIYREGQMKILGAAVTESEEVLSDIYNRHLGKGIHTLQLSLQDLEFADAIKICFGTADYDELVAMQQDDIVGMLHLCWKYLTGCDDSWDQYVECLGQSYRFPADVGEDEVDEATQEVYDGIFPAAAEASPKVFGLEGWTPQLLKWGMTVYQDEGVSIVVDGKQFVVLCLEA